MRGRFEQCKTLLLIHQSDEMVWQGGNVPDHPFRQSAVQDKYAIGREREKTMSLVG